MKIKQALTKVNEGCIIAVPREDGRVRYFVRGCQHTSLTDDDALPFHKSEASAQTCAAAVMRGVRDLHGGL